MEQQAIDAGVFQRLFIRTPYNKPLHYVDEELGTQESMTIPDQALTLRQILQRHASGLPLDDVRRVPFYDYDDEYDDIEESAEAAGYKHMDLADQQAFRERQSLKVKHLQTALAIQQADHQDFTRKVNDYAASQKASPAGQQPNQQSPEKPNKEVL